MKRGGRMEYLRYDLDYPAKFQSPALRSAVKLEVTFQSPLLKPDMLPVRSIVSETIAASRGTLATEPPPAEIQSVQPLETASQKFNVLTQYALNAERGPADHFTRADKTFVRHVHDLAALEPAITKDPKIFARLTADRLPNELSREYTAQPEAGVLEKMREAGRLLRQPPYPVAYERYVQQMSYQRPSERLSYDRALASVERSAKHVELRLRSLGHTLPTDIDSPTQKSRRRPKL